MVPVYVRDFGAFFCSSPFRCFGKVFSCISDENCNQRPLIQSQTTRTVSTFCRVSAGPFSADLFPSEGPGAERMPARPAGLLRHVEQKIIIPKKRSAPERIFFIHKGRTAPEPVLDDTHLLSSRSAGQFAPGSLSTRSRHSATSSSLFLAK